MEAQQAQRALEAAVGRVLAVRVLGVAPSSNGVARVYWIVFAGPLGSHAGTLRLILVLTGAVTALGGALMCLLQHLTQRAGAPVQESIPNSTKKPPIALLIPKFSAPCKGAR